MAFITYQDFFFKKLDLNHQQLPLHNKCDGLSPDSSLSILPYPEKSVDNQVKPYHKWYFQPPHISEVIYM